MYQVGFLGLGKMGSSILNGILRKELYRKEDISFYAPSKETQNKYVDLGLNLSNDEKDLIQNSKIIILAIKPQQYQNVLDTIKDLKINNKIIISLAPGKSINYLKQYFKESDIVRAMPNTPALIGKSTTTLAFSDRIIDEVINIFSSIGTYIVLEEQKIDEAIPLNGSMPAYIFEFIRSFIKEGINYGFSEEEAKKLVLNAVIGSSLLALESDDSLDTLIDNVCSKGGSTIMGLNELRNNHFDDIIAKCYRACVKRSKELENV